MAIKDPSSTTINNTLDGTRHEKTGAKYEAKNTEGWWEWIMSTLYHLGEASAGWLQVREDDSSALAVRVTPGRASFDGAAYSYAGGVVSGLTNNDTTYIWAEIDGGSLTIDSGIDGSGWPATAHLKLAEVTISAGAISGIVDRRQELMLRSGGIVGAELSTALAGELLTWSISIDTQGDTSTASRIHIQLQDINGNDVARQHLLGVLICDQDGYDNATNATIAVAGGTTLARAFTAGKDVMLQSDANGLIEIDLTDATAETVTLRIGPAPVGAERGDYTATQDVTHA